MNCCQYYLQIFHLPADPFIATEMATEKKQRILQTLKPLRKTFYTLGGGARPVPTCQAAPGTGLPEVIRRVRGREGPGWRQLETRE